MRRLAGLVLALSACGDSSAPTPPAISFGTIGPIGGAGGKGSFRFGAASAATQIEDMNVQTDWYVWTAPPPSGMGRGTYVGDAVRGYTLAMPDVQLVKTLGLDSYRFSIEWARIEPQRNVIDEGAIQHYRDELGLLKQLGIRPVVTLHHFSNPVWIADPRDIACGSGPRDTNLCGLGSTGGPQIVSEMGQHAALVAQRFGDLVDEWGTENEPVNYLFAAYGVGKFPPGRVTLTSLVTGLVPVFRDYLAAHAAMYDAIKANDTVDADGDGVAAYVGLSLAVVDWEPARGNQPSQNPEDIAARDRLVNVFHYMYVDSIVNGQFDSNLDGTPDETHPEWLGRLDWLGLQYYFRGGVTASPAVLSAPLSLTPCMFGLDLGACLPAANPSYCVPTMSYEYWSDGIAAILEKFGARYPQLPLVITEAGIATDVGARRGEQIVRGLESIARARDAGVDVRGFYEWSLTDNFEWAQGFTPHFGLYSVDYSSYARTPSEGADVLAAIAAARAVTGKQRAQYGGTGAMTPETVASDQFCITH